MNIQGCFTTQSVKGIKITDNFYKKRNNLCSKNMVITEFPVCYNSQACEWPQKISETGILLNFVFDNEHSHPRTMN